MSSPNRYAPLACLNNACTASSSPRLHARCDALYIFLKKILKSMSAKRRVQLDGGGLNSFHYLAILICDVWISTANDERFDDQPDQIRSHRQKRTSRERIVERRVAPRVSAVHFRICGQASLV